MTVKNDKNILAKIIKETRKVAGLTQLELATRAGVGKTLVYNLEKGSSKVSLENLLKVLKILNIKIEYKVPFNLGDQ